MTKTIMKAVGAVAAGRNRKVHMKTVSVTIYCDKGSKGSNPALPQKSYRNGSFFQYKIVSLLAIPAFPILYVHHVCLSLFLSECLVY